jgi:pimeloyl-ACP methyl ester carboxylesterase
LASNDRDFPQAAGFARVGSPSRWQERRASTRLGIHGFAPVNFLWNSSGVDSIRSHLTLVSSLRGISQLAVAAVVGATDIVEEMQRSIVRRSPPVGGTGERGARGISGLVYRSIRRVTHGIGAGLDRALVQVAPLVGRASTPSSPRREAVLAALNGVLGDYLAATNNPLAITMCFRKNGQPLLLERKALTSAFARADRKLLVLVHGLCMTDMERHRQGRNHASSLARDLGYTPIYLHYNSGRHVSTNGREFADAMERLIQAWPARVDEVVIVGHSMGGLVSRSACHYAARAGHRWLPRLKKLIFLGTPHHGAPLERAGNWVEILMGFSRYTAPLAKLGRIRSAGVRDLRFGNILDEDWQGQPGNHAHDPRRLVPLPARVQCYAIAATRRAKSAGRNRRLPGDGLVPVMSAHGQHDNPELDLSIPQSRRFTVYGSSHFDLRTSRKVYDRIRLWLSEHG